MPPNEPMPSSGDARETLARLGRLFRKELSEMLRDRRTILTLVLMPVLLYPLLGLAFKQFFLASGVEPGRGIVYRLGFASNEESRAFVQFMVYAGTVAKGKQTAPDPDLTQGEQLLKLLPFNIKIEPDLRKLLQDGEIDLGLRIKDADKVRVPPRQDEMLQAEALYLPGQPLSQGALAFIEQRLAALNEANLRARIKPEQRLFPPATYMSLTRTALETRGTETLISLPALVPLVLILMTITGAVYPAIDLTAGERERGTLEILVAAPVPRLGLLFAKYLTVLTIAVLTALVNLTTMMITLLVSGLGQVLFEGGISLDVVLEIFGLLLLFAAFFSAVLLSLTSFARSFKEAQAYLIPLMLASLGPGVLGMMPGLKLHGPLAVVPLVNIVLLARDLFQGGADPAMALVVVLSTLMYAAAAIALAARVFGAESVLYSEQSGWSDLLRRPAEAQPTASVSAALWALALMIPLHFVLAALLRVVAPLLPRAALFLGLALLAVVLFMILPLLSAYFGKVRLASGFALRGARPLVLGGALLLGLSLWPFVFQLLIWFLGDKLEAFRKLIEAQVQQLRVDRSTLFPILAFSFAAQGIAEEFFFRGYLFQALRRGLNARETIGLSALLFGLMHVVLGAELGWERFMPSTLLGLVLGWVAWRAGSVLPAMLLHACHNVLLNILPLVTDTSPEPGEFLPWTWLALGAVGALAGSLAVWLATRPIGPTR